MDDVKIWCTNCGTRLSTESAAEHPPQCRPRWIYWWPREHPYMVALIALAMGLVLGIGLWP